MANCADCGVEYDYSNCFGICLKCEKKHIENFWNSPVWEYKPHNNNIVEKPEILTSDQEAQVSRLVNNYGMGREDAITSLKKFWDNQKL